jgi:hypothetical protein
MSCSQHFWYPPLCITCYQNWHLIKKKGYVQEGLTIEMKNREEMSQEDHTKTAQYFYQVITREKGFAQNYNIEAMIKLIQR